MKIEIKTPQVVYITIDNHTYYIDNSTDEQIISKWRNDDYIVRDREAGNIIVNQVTLEEAEKLLQNLKLMILRMTAMNLIFMKL